MRLERFGFRAMGSPCELALYAETRAALTPIVDACAREIARLEHKYSRYREDSLASRINRSAGDADGIELDDETAALLDFAETAWQESEGRFDPTSGTLRHAWDFKSGRLPSASSIAQALECVGFSKLRWDRPRLVLPIPGIELDFGGFVKEYAADRVAELARSLGQTSGIVDLGGDLAVIGPHPNGEPWLVGIRNPRRPQEAMARIGLSSGGLATSGDYERFMIIDGIRYSHLLDPRTGQSFRGGPACVSVTADHCLIAGVTSTIAMLHEEDECERFLERIGLTHLAVTQSGAIRGTATVIAPERSERRRTPRRPPAFGNLEPPARAEGTSSNA